MREVYYSMANIWLYTLVSVVVVSLISLLGIFTLVLDTNRLSKILLFLLSFAIGGLFGDAIIHLIPQSFETLGFGLNTSLFILGGIMLFFTLEKLIRWKHCHATNTHEHVHPVVPLSLLSDAVHNFIDGMIIGASYLASIPIGITTTLAVILHEIPHEIGDFGVLVHGGLSIKKAIVFNFLTALTAILGGVVALLIGAQFKVITDHIIPLTAGGFLYVAGSDLIPELQQGCDIKLSDAVLQFSFITLGIAMMAGLIVLE
jgi:zinc and cadmium transporter